MKKFFQSRKFIVFLVSLIIYVINAVVDKTTGFGLPSEHATKLIVLIIGWLTAQGIADIGDANKTKKEVEDKAKEINSLANFLIDEFERRQSKKDETDQSEKGEDNERVN